MKEYPSTHKPFKVNGKTCKMRKLTLGLQADIEDENIKVTLEQVVLDSTNMTKDEIRELDADQFKSIYDDVMEFTYTSNESGEGDPKKQ